MCQHEAAFDFCTAATDKLGFTTSTVEFQEHLQQLEGSMDSWSSEVPKTVKANTETAAKLEAPRTAAAVAAPREQERAAEAM